MGEAGKTVKGQVNKVTGLDPAGPGFDVNDPGKRLSTDSAKYTECIHTSVPFGIVDPICHVDFYINAGSRQPGCITMLDTDNVICSHARAIQIAIETMVNPKSLYGSRCQDLQAALAGNCHASPGAFINDQQNEVDGLTGVFNVETNAEAPFGRGRV